jgi:hypothetical protein
MEMDYKRGLSSAYDMSYRSRQAIAAGVTVALSLVAIFLCFIVWYSSWFVVVVLGALSCAVLFGVIPRMLVSGIYLRRWGFMLRTLYRAHHVNWEDVAGFEQILASPVYTTVYIAARLNDRRVLKTTFLTATKRDSAFARLVLEELNARLAASRKAVLSAEPGSFTHLEE